MHTHQWDQSCSWLQSSEFHALKAIFTYNNCLSSSGGKTKTWMPKAISKSASVFYFNSQLGITNVRKRQKAILSQRHTLDIKNGQQELWSQQQAGTREIIDQCIGATGHLPGRPAWQCRWKYPSPWTAPTRRKESDDTNHQGTQGMTGLE